MIFFQEQVAGKKLLDFPHEHSQRCGGGSPPGRENIKRLLLAAIAAVNNCMKKSDGLLVPKLISWSTWIQSACPYMVRFKQSMAGFRLVSLGKSCFSFEYSGERVKVFFSFY